jgi:hypothetical protein
MEGLIIMGQKQIPNPRHRFKIDLMNELLQDYTFPNSRGGGWVCHHDRKHPKRLVSKSRIRDILRITDRDIVIGIGEPDVFSIYKGKTTRWYDCERINTFLEQIQLSDGDHENKRTRPDSEGAKHIA